MVFPAVVFPSKLRVPRPGAVFGQRCGHRCGGPSVGQTDGRPEGLQGLQPPATHGALCLCLTGITKTTYLPPDLSPALGVGERTKGRKPGQRSMHLCHKLQRTPGAGPIRPPPRPSGPRPQGAHRARGLPVSFCAHRSAASPNPGRFCPPYQHVLSWAPPDKVG